MGNSASTTFFFSYLTSGILEIFVIDDFPRKLPRKGDFMYYFTWLRMGISASTMLKLLKLCPGAQKLYVKHLKSWMYTN